jgi:hypothetical protein
MVANGSAALQVLDPQFVDFTVATYSIQIPYANTQVTPAEINTACKAITDFCESERLECEFILDPDKSSYPGIPTLGIMGNPRGAQQILSSLLSFVGAKYSVICTATAERLRTPTGHAIGAVVTALLESVTSDRSVDFQRLQQCPGNILRPEVTEDDGERATLMFGVKAYDSEAIDAAITAVCKTLNVYCPFSVEMKDESNFRFFHEFDRSKPPYVC